MVFNEIADFAHPESIKAFTLNTVLVKCIVIVRKCSLGTKEALVAVGVSLYTG